jgi:hypothetical protein
LYEPGTCCTGCLWFCFYNSTSLNRYMELKHIDNHNGWCQGWRIADTREVGLAKLRHSSGMAPVANATAICAGVVMKFELCRSWKKHSYTYYWCMSLHVRNTPSRPSSYLLTAPLTRCARLAQKLDLRTSRTYAVAD